MKKNASSVSPLPCAAALLAGCGSISSKDGGYYPTEAAAQESYNYDSAAGVWDSEAGERRPRPPPDETAQKNYLQRQSVDGVHRL